MDIKEINYQKKYIEATKTIDRLTSDNVNLHAELDNFKDFVEQEEIKRNDFIDQLQDQVKDLGEKLGLILKEL